MPRSLQTLENGTIADATVVNANFTYLDERINTVGSGITSLQSSISSVNTNLNTEISTLSSSVQTGLSGKANTNLTNAVPTSAFATAMNTAGIRTVVEVSAKSSLPSWYRVWSDKWCEQGGYITNSTSVYAGTTVNLIKNFKDTNYHILTTGNIHNKSDGGADQKAGSAIAGNATVVDNTSFKIATHQAIPGYYWRAYGYVS